MAHPIEVQITLCECCAKYPYVARKANNQRPTTMGQKIRKNPVVLTWFIIQAHKNGAKYMGWVLPRYLVEQAII
jgi:hypothetical protein